jgi:hypothetical protein
MMQTKKSILVSLLLLLMQSSNAQAIGNYDYRSAANYTFTPTVHIAQAANLAILEPQGQNTFSIKGLFNCKADSYLAIFTITQVGKTQVETDALVRAKTDSIKTALKRNGVDVEVFVDMISFIPIYEYEVTKKLFSKDTYNEIPKGFELKKNLHFRFTDPEVLESLVTLCAKQEIYDLVRVDYFIEDIEVKKAEMMAKAEELLEKQVSRYKRLLDEDFSDRNKLLADGFAMYYPVEQYKTYTAYTSNKINIVKANGTVSQVDKTTSQFYMPKMSKGYDFVIHASMLEPVVQIEYELLLKFYPKPKEQKQQVKEIVKTEIQQEVILITPDGQLKTLKF